MFWITNKKNRYTAVNPVLLYKVVFKGVYIARTCYPDAFSMKPIMLGSTWLAFSSEVNVEVVKASVIGDAVLS